MPNLRAQLITCCSKVMTHGSLRARQRCELLHAGCRHAAEHAPRLMRAGRIKRCLGAVAARLGPALQEARCVELRMQVGLCGMARLQPHQLRVGIDQRAQLRPASTRKVPKNACLSGLTGFGAEADLLDQLAPFVGVSCSNFGQGRR